jgi:hypothetical protein
MNFLLKNNNILKIFCFNILVSFFLLTVFHFLNIIDINFFLRFRYFAFLVFFFFSFLLFLFFEKEKKKKEKFEKYFRYSFLFGLFLIGLGVLKPEFLNSVGQYVVGFTTFCGFFTFYFNYDKNFEKIPVNIKKHYILLSLIFLLFLITRLYNNDFVNGSDNYNLLGIKNLYENGISFYKYSVITDSLMLFFVKLFGFNFFSIKIPFLIYSFITLIFLYLISRKIDRNLALLSTFLFAISPWAIIQSRITRDYSFDLMVASIVIFLGFVFYERIREQKNLRKTLFLFLGFNLIPIFIFLLAEFNRSQVLTTGIYFLIIFVFVIYALIEKFRTELGKGYWFLITVALLAVMFCLNKWPFNFGFQKPEFAFLKMFFDPNIDAPWQWFHGIRIEMLWAFFLFIFILGILSFKQKKYSKDYLLMLGGSFAFIILLYSLKYNSHLEYIPSRYIYFALIPFILIFSNGILNLFKIFSKREKTFLFIFLLILINYNAIIYATYPLLQYQKEGVANLQIDNIGLGRFDLVEVVDYLETELGVTDETTLVMGGRYEELILYSDRPMDSSRKLQRPNKEVDYNIAENTYIQSNYFQYYELSEALEKSENGIYLTREPILHNYRNNTFIRLTNNDFHIYGTRLNFVDQVKDFRIYFWSRD